MSTAQLLFLPWVRAGVGAQLATKDGEPGLCNNGTLGVVLQLNGSALPEQHLRVLGPGDVVGVDVRQLLRTDPTPGSNSVETERLVTLDFDDPSLPWLFTPASASADRERLRPWVALVVVRRQAGVTLTSDGQRGTAVLRVTAPAVPDEELPDPTQAWAWAHVQLAAESGTGPEDVQMMLRNAPARTLSRLICPRQLAQNTTYIACLVPTFGAGRDAALGRPVDPDGALTSAWNRGESEVVLPVYHAWEFSTGEAGDFRALVGKLHGIPAPHGVGERNLDVSAVGAAAGTLLAAGGALGRPTAGPAGDAPTEVQAHLAGLLTGAGDVRPPVYGSPQCRAPASAPGDPGWLRELNLDPRWRSAAALGAAVVQDQQDVLVAAAWQQAGAALEANALVQRAELAVQANASLLRRRLVPLTADELLEVTAPAQDRLGASPVAGGGMTANPGPLIPFGLLVQRFLATAHSAVPQSGAYRKARRPGGPLARAAGAARLSPHGAPLLPAAVALRSRDAVLDQPDSTNQAELTLLGAAVRQGILDRLTPDQRVAERVAARIDDDPTAPAAATRAATNGPQALQLRQFAPRIDTPLFAWLAKIAPQAVLPGVDLIPQDTVILLRADPAFMAAFLAGFNSELARELVWRGYPVDSTATYARVFWDYRGKSAAPQPDVPPLADWPAGTALRDLATTAGGGQQMVLCVRGELLRRYPRTHVYAVRADWVGPAGGSRKAADVALPGNVCEAGFSGSLGSDIRFYGFALPLTAVLGSLTEPGWFFAFQEQAVETRFGGPLPDLTGATSADVAVAARRPPVRVLIHADALLAGPTGGE